MAHRLRVVMDAIRYMVCYGVEWRALPADFPPWQESGLGRRALSHTEAGTEHRFSG
jgi:transposase